MKRKELKELIIAIGLKYVSLEEAEYFANEIVETDLRKPPHKKYSDDLLHDIQSWQNKTKEVEKTVDLPGYTQFNFNELGPSLKLKEIHDILESKANQNGISMVSIINSAGMHTMHLWTQGLAKRGLFALCSWNGGPDAVVPFNGTTGILGTNPFSYAFPSDTGEVVVDMATSEIPYFKIVQAKKDEKNLPQNTAVDAAGEITTDANKALDATGVSNLLPMGANYKGYNINYLMEIMTSALIGAKISAQMGGDYIEKDHGGFIIAIAIDKITNRKQYDASVKAMNEEIRNQTPKTGIDKVIVPGDTNLARMNGVDDDSEIEIDAEYYDRLVELSK
jgi:LDH2 family malate/lactate/ureidoglycolate dehydrogenase